MLFELIGFEGLRDIVIFLTSISSESLRKKNYLNWGEKTMKIIL